MNADDQRTSPAEVPDRDLESADNADRFARAMAALVLAELPVSLAEEWLCGCTELTDRIRDLTRGVCSSYNLKYTEIGPAVITEVLDHLCSYFADLEPGSAVEDLPKQKYCDRKRAWVVNNVAECFGTFRAGLIALLRRAADDFTAEDNRPQA